MKPWTAVLLAFACAHPAAPTISGADLYARVDALRAMGHAQIGSIEVRRDQYLVSSDTEQVFAVAQVLDKCNGGGLDADPDCTLVLVRDLRFRVVDRAPTAPAPKREDGMTAQHKAQLIGLAAAAPLTYGAFACHFDGCWAVFGVPLVFDAAFLLIATVGMR